MKTRSIVRVAAVGAAVAALSFLGLAPARATVTSLSPIGTNSGSYDFTDVGQAGSDPGAAAFVNYAGNPVISGTNLYAADPVDLGTAWNVYYGGWQTSAQTNDDVYLQTTSSDTLATGFSPVTEVVDHGYYTHANDPSVVKQGSTWTMALTTTLGADQCSLLTSGDGTTWPALTDRSHQISFAGAAVSTCARPSLNFNSAMNEWELYFDGVVNGGPQEQHLAVAPASDPTAFTYVQSIGTWFDADIRRLANGTYIAAYRTADTNPVWYIDYSTSTDGRTFTPSNVLLQQDPLKSYDDCGVTNPGWAIRGSTIVALMFGGTSSCNYNTHKLGVAYPQAQVTLFSSSVAHVDREALNPDTQTFDTHGYDTISRITVQNDPLGSNVIDQAVSGTIGEVWSVAGRTLSQTPVTSAFSSSDVAANPPTDAVDGSSSTFFSSAPRTSAADSEALALDTGSIQTLRGMTLVPRAGGYGFPTAFVIQSSTDGVNWTTVPGQSYTSFANPGSTPVDLAFAGGISARYLQIVATSLGTDDYGHYYLQLAEARPET